MTDSCQPLRSSILKGLENYSKTEDEIVATIFVDVSELVKVDLGTGIQRVVKSILREFLSFEKKKYKVVPVCANLTQQGYFYVAGYEQYLAGNCKMVMSNLPIKFSPGDIFFGLDIQFSLIPYQINYLEKLKKNNVKIVFMLHDLLPLNFPNFFREDVKSRYEKWLISISSVADGVVCVSKTVLNQFVDWLECSGLQRTAPLGLGWSHNGCDLVSSIPTFGLPDGANNAFINISKRLTFISVGTIEPRKMHAQMIAAFNILWSKDVQVNLILIGREGWDHDDIKIQIIENKYFGDKLFWFNGPSDEFLQEIYKRSDCLLLCTVGEGFGLPIVEAAQHNLPMLIRDLPIFKEVAGSYAAYFSGSEPEDLVNAIERWIIKKSTGELIQSSGMPKLSWNESAMILYDLIVNRRWQNSWMQ